MRLVYITVMDEEFSRTIKAGHIRETAQTHEVAADEAARAALAARFGLPGIARLEGRFVLRHERSGIIAATLALRAEVTQICVVSLEPFTTEIVEESALRFVPARDSAVDEDEEGEDLTPETLEGPDELPYVDDTIDLGAALAEQLALALPPYPRKPDAELPASARDAQAHPFAALARQFDAKTTLE